MHLQRPHLTNAARYPVLRALAILHMVAAIAIPLIGVWRAVRVLAWGGDTISHDLFGNTNTFEARLMVAVSWLALTFVLGLFILAVAELIKLFMDIERNTRAAAHGPAAMSSAASVSAVPGDGAAMSPAGGRVAMLVEGEETAEGALLRGH